MPERCIPSSVMRSIASVMKPSATHLRIRVQVEWKWSLRERVLRLVGKKYSGEEGERFGPTLAAEHLASDDQVEVNAQTLRRWMLSGVGRASGVCIASGENGKSMWGNWCRWMEVFTTGWRDEGRVAA